jgi:hypothetical protein
MRVSVMQNQMQHALGKLKAIPRYKALPNDLTDGVKLEACDFGAASVLYVSRTSLDTLYSVSIPARIDRVGSCVVRHADILEMVSNVSPEKIDYVVSPDNGVLTETVGMSRTRYNPLDPDAWRNTESVKLYGSLIHRDVPIKQWAKELKSFTPHYLAFTDGQIAFESADRTRRAAFEFAHTIAPAAYTINGETFAKILAAMADCTEASLWFDAERRQLTFTGEEHQITKVSREHRLHNLFTHAAAFSLSPVKARQAVEHTVVGAFTVTANHGAIAQYLKRDTRIEWQGDTVKWFTAVDDATVELPLHDPDPAYVVITDLAVPPNTYHMQGKVFNTSAWHIDGKTGKAIAAILKANAGQPETRTRNEVAAIPVRIELVALANGLMLHINGAYLEVGVHDATIHPDRFTFVFGSTELERLIALNTYEDVKARFINDRLLGVQLSSEWGILIHQLDKRLVYESVRRNGDRLDRRYIGIYDPEHAAYREAGLLQELMKYIPSMWNRVVSSRKSFYATRESERFWKAVHDAMDAAANGNDALYHALPDTERAQAFESLKQAKTEVKRRQWKSQSVSAFITRECDRGTTYKGWWDTYQKELETAIERLTPPKPKKARKALVTA